MQTETASALAETEGGREICTGNLQYTLPVASSRSISSLKCRDMRGRPSIYAFYGIIGEHISFGITCGCRCGGPMWYSRSFADAQDDKKPLGMTTLCIRSFAAVQDDKSGFVQDDKSGFVRDDKSSFVQDEGAVFRSGIRGVRALLSCDVCPEGVESQVDVFVSAVDLLDVADDARAFGRHCSKQKSDSCTDVW